MPTTHSLSRGGLAVAFSVLVSLAAPACGGGDASPDAPPDGAASDAPDARPVCYSGGGTPTPGAEVDVGAFRDGIGYAPLQENDELTVYAGGQGGHHFFLHARIRGMSPGDRDEPLETQPATWFTAYREDGTDINVLPCVYPLAYEKNEDGDWVLPYSPLSLIAGGQVPGIYGKRVRIKVEVMDGEGRYATDEQWVIAVPQEEAPDAGPPDAGPPDAGPPDAAPGTAPDASGILAE
jgi:hypothetical protein